MYSPKPIDDKLILEIKKMEMVPHYNTYRADLKEVGIPKSHDFRVTFANDSLQNKLEQRILYKQVIKRNKSLSSKNDGILFK